MRVLVTGGAGYIGSHTTVELIRRGHDVVVLDNFSNSSPLALKGVEKIVGRSVPFENADIRDPVALNSILAGHRCDAVIHFAALKAVGESCAEPLKYFDNNIVGTIRLLQAMQDGDIRLLVFSSSATVYGQPELNPIAENAPRQVSNPYGRSKLVAEDLIGDVCTARGGFRAAILRYFNPVGAHASGLIGEDPRGIPNNLMPYICRVAAGRLPELPVFGDDYPTPDGTAIRDYLHVMDLARAHVDALDYLQEKNQNLTVNLGTGQGHSVLEIIRAFERANGLAIPHRMMPRRPGDVAQIFADVALAERLLGWKTEFDLKRMCQDAWRWQSLNPDGFTG
jgi:UDP-glucose 4-epimerase